MDIVALKDSSVACLQAEEAKAMAQQMVEVYADFAINCAAMPVIPGALDCLSMLKAAKACSAVCPRNMIMVHGCMQAGSQG